MSLPMMMDAMEIFFLSYSGDGDFRRLQETKTLPPNAPTPPPSSNFDRVLQITFCIAFIVIFCGMMCISVFGRRTQPFEHSTLPPLAARMSEKDRRDYVTKALVVKHVIRKPDMHGEEEQLSNQSSSSTTTTSSEEHTDGKSLDPLQSCQQHQHPITTSSDAKEGEEQESKVEDHPGTQPPHHEGTSSFRRLKSNLIMADDDDDDNPDDLEANTTRDSTREPWLCAICLKEYEIGEEICWSHNPKCNHVFHHECIEEWLLKHDECPCCRSNYLAPANDGSGVCTVPLATTTNAVPRVEDFARPRRPHARLVGDDETFLSWAEQEVVRRLARLEESRDVPLGSATA